MRVALKIDVASERGFALGVPALLELFSNYDVRATFFFAMEFASGKGLVRRAFSRLLGSDVSRMSLEEAIHAVVEGGHEIGLYGFDADIWRRQAAFADTDWTKYQLALGMEKFETLTGQPPDCFAAPAWQPNAHLFEMEEQSGFQYASDVRGKFPFFPQLHNIVSRCPQIPTTLPTIQELLAQGEATPDNVHEHLYVESRRVLPHGHVFTADAEEVGSEYLDTMEKLIVMWQGQEGSLRSLGEVRAELDLEKLPVHQVGWAPAPGRQEHVATQSLPVEL